MGLGLGAGGAVSQRTEVTGSLGVLWEEWLLDEVLGGQASRKRVELNRKVRA